MSQAWVKVVVPRTAESPRGARWAAEAALGLARAWQWARERSVRSSSIGAAA